MTRIFPAMVNECHIVYVHDIFDSSLLWQYSRLVATSGGEDTIRGKYIRSGEYSFKKIKRALIVFTGDMMDLEGYAKRGLRKGDPKLLEKLTDRILEIKSISREGAEKLASAVITEAKATLDIKDDSHRHAALRRHHGRVRRRAPGAGATSTRTRRSPK